MNVNAITLRALENTPAKEFGDIARMRYGNPKKKEVSKFPIKFKWKRKIDYSAAITEYTLVFKGWYDDGREFYYTGKISKDTDYDNGLKTTYSFDCTLFSDINDFQLRPSKCSDKGLKTLNDAKKHVEVAFRAKWICDQLKEN